MPDVPPAYLYQVYICRLFAFAGGTLILYDYLLTCLLEVTYVWGSPWTFVKTLFLINRYVNLIGQTFLMLVETGYLAHNSQKFCAAYELFCTLFAVFAAESIRLLVVVRACAILGCRRSIALFVNTLYVLFAVTLSILSIYWAKTAAAVDFVFLGETGICYKPVGPRSWRLFAIPLSLDVFILALVCMSLYRVSRWSHGRGSSGLVRLLARDAVLFYITALFNLLFSIACWIIYPLDPRNALPILLTTPLLTVVGQRLVLNLRRFRAKQDSTRNLGEQINEQMVLMVSEGPSDQSTELDELGRG